MTSTPEQIWWDNRHPADAAAVPHWTDVLIDLRWGDRHPLPDLWEGADLQRIFPSDADGWSLDAIHCHHDRFDPTRGGDTFVRFTTPTGFRFTTAFTKTKTAGFAYGAMKTTFPTMYGVLASTAAKDPLQVTGFSKKRHRIYNLPALAEAVANPNRWWSMPPDTGHRTLNTDAAQLLLQWASAGEDKWANVERLVAVGMTPVQHRRWSWEWTDQEIIDWCQSFAPDERQWAREWRGAGWTAQEAKEWLDITSEALLCGKDLAEFRNAGLTPRETMDLLNAWAAMEEQQYYERHGEPHGGFGIYQCRFAAQWLFIPDHDRRMAYLTLGTYTISQAAAMERSDHPPTLAQLSTLAALRH